MLPYINQIILLSKGRSDERAHELFASYGDTFMNMLYNCVQARTTHIQRHDRFVKLKSTRKREARDDEGTLIFCQ